VFPHLLELLSNEATTMTARSKLTAALKRMFQRKRTVIGGLCAAMIGVMVSSPAMAWYDNNWTYRKAITIDTKSSEATDGLKHYPVLIRLDSSQFNFEEAQKNAADLRFVDQDDKTVLNYQLESFDPS